MIAIDTKTGRTIRLWGDTDCLHPVTDIAAYGWLRPKGWTMLWVKTADGHSNDGRR